MKILITGSDGFIGKNLLSHLSVFKNIQATCYSSQNDLAELSELIRKSDLIIHLAGKNRPTTVSEFLTSNIDLTKNICDLIELHNLQTPIIFTSSTQAELDTPYGSSKLESEKILAQFSSKNSSPVIIYRLPGVFGKWSRPNYNSVVATFCHNIANDIPIAIDDPKKTLKLVYIDDVINQILNDINNLPLDLDYRAINPEYSISLEDLSSELQSFKYERKNLTIGAVGSGLTRALYSTYISFLPNNQFSYFIPTYEDQRGLFVEVLKNESTGQLSYITIKPGETRGNHFHHTKTEAFLVIKGEASFRFENTQDHTVIEINTSAKQPQIVQTIPGWAHNISNTGSEELIAILWANEVFNKQQPDTFKYELDK